MPYSPDGQMATQQDVMDSINKAFNPVQAAGGIAKGYQQALPAGQPGSTQGEPSPEASSDPQSQMHMLTMQQKAEDAKQKYMQDNGVDENGNKVEAAQ